MLDTSYKKILAILKGANVGVLVEDNYADFKNFFARWEEPQLEGTCITIEFVLMEYLTGKGSDPFIEFHCHFYSTKNRNKQRLLSKDDFLRLKKFLDVQIFIPGGLEVVEYSDVKRDYRTNRMRLLFANSEPGVIIQVGGLLTTKQTNGGKDVISTR